MKSLYFLILFGTVIVPFLFSFHPKLRFDKTFKSFFIANALVALLFILWDIRFTQLGVWGFNPRYVSGIFIINLPIEEVLFFICIPFSCMFTYHCLTKFYTFNWNPNTANRVVLSLAILLFLTGIYFYPKAYTSVTLVSLSILLLLLQFIARVNWLSKLLSIYPILLVPFFIVNGILTGSGIEQPVVWYNDAENLGIRLFTIPIEDVFYGFELILLNLFVYEWLLSLRPGNKSMTL